MNFVLLPQWIDDALQSLNQDRQVILDVKKLATILSQDDVAFYIYVNHPEQTRKLTTEVIPETFAAQGGNFYEQVWSLKENAFNDVNYNEYQRKNVFEAIMKSYEAIHETHRVQRNKGGNDPALLEFFNCNAEQLRNGVVDYHVECLDENTIIMIPYLIMDHETQGQPKAVTANTATKSFYSKLLSIVCGVKAFTEVAQTRLFHDYVYVSQMQARL